MIKRLAYRFFRWFCHPNYFDEIQGDLEELYQRNTRQGKQIAQWKYLLQVLVLFRPSLIRSFPQSYLTQPAMFRHYFNISTRVLLRHKFYSAINILGLAVGMGVALLICQYIHFELSYDQFHTDVDNIYRLTQETVRNRENQGAGVYTTYGLGPSGKENIPEVSDFVRIRTQAEGPIVINPETQTRSLEDEIWYVDSSFLQLFNFSLIYGDQSTALNKKHSIVITEQKARKYFGDTDPVGKDLRVSLGGLSGDYIVTGVLKTLPANSHLQFDFLIPLTFVLENYRFYSENDSEGWGLADFVTYVKLHENGDINEVSEKLSQLMATHAIGDAEGASTDWKIGLQPITNIHLKSNFLRDIASHPGDIQNVQFFAIVGLFILLMAWINYINLSTARAMHRAKEVGVRKTIGAVRNQLVGQFMTESIIINVIAASLSIGVAFSVLPMLNNILGREMSFTVFQTIEFWWTFSLAILVGSLLSGLYPAFVLSSFNPLIVLKSSTGTPKRGFNLRRGLIAFQFLISLLLISGAYLVYQQITFMKDQDLGIDMEKILILNGPRVFLETLEESGLTEESRQEVFRNKLLTHHSITSFSLASSIPSEGYFYTESFRKAGTSEDTDQNASYVLVDSAFAHTYDLEFLSKATSYEKKKYPNQPAIVNEETVKAFSLGSAEEALHQILINNWGDSLEIVGVVKNIHWSSLKNAYTPTLFIFANYGGYFSIRMNLSDIQVSIAHIKSAYHEVFPDDPFNYFFLDDAFNQQYQADIQFRNLFSSFSILAIFIACLGLFALVSYSATLRIKEIGIRKVLGSSISNLMLLLSREYLILLAIAVVLAIPATIIGGRAWLENYAYKTEIGLDLLLIPGLILLFISVLTVSYRTYAAAKTNPAESLKAE
ncbi:MAG: ABC transporter permease [Bacteroidota bacterium]